MEIYFLEGEFDREKAQKWGGKLLFFNPDYVLNENHIHFALWHAKKALENGTNIARDLQLEFLVRLSGRRQIKKALDLLPERKIGVCVLEGDIESFCIETELHEAGRTFPSHNEALRKTFNIERDVKDLEKEIFEKIAMTDI